jgi:hypothetical protein
MAVDIREQADVMKRRRRSIRKRNRQKRGSKYG